MKLSEAIRLGAMMKPQGKFELLSADGKATCALGAACDAVGIRMNAGGPHTASYRTLISKWPFLENKWITIALMNDSGMSREAVSEFIEQQLEATTAPACELEHAERC